MAFLHVHLLGQMECALDVVHRFRPHLVRGFRNMVRRSKAAWGTGPVCLSVDTGIGDAIGIVG